MSNYSPTASRVMYSGKSSARPAGQKITRVIVHHWAGTGQSGINRLVHSADKASANYIIADGQIIGSVPENRRAWTSGSSAADNPSITIEVQNSGGAPSWPVSDANITALTRLIADIADRYKWGTLTASHVRGHREFASTACPGPYLWPRLAGIRAAAQALRESSPAAPAPDPAKPTPATRYPDIPLLVDGKWGPVTTRALQLVLPKKYNGGRDLLPDGVFGPVTVKAVQRWLAALGHYDGRIDGVFGPMTRRALQSFLYDKGLYRNGRYSKTVMVDGAFKSRSIKALQTYLNNQRQYLTGEVVK